MSLIQHIEIHDDTDSAGDELKPGSQLLHGQYTIERYLSAGGFGITYLARDSLERRVVIKECFLSSICRRSHAVVYPRSRAYSKEMAAVVSLFLREARSLAKLVHPNIVGVHEVFEDNGTAYMALDFVTGRDLQEVMADPATALSPTEIRSVLIKLLDAVQFIHDRGMLHRDISPDNVLLDANRNPILIDFGAAHDQDNANPASPALSTLRVVKDGYSPQELYVVGSENGPWSDLYALAATIYRLVAGEPPPNGQLRLAAVAGATNDPYVPLAGRFPAYDEPFLAAIDKSLQVLPKNRIQTARDWREMITAPVPKTGSVVELPPSKAGVKSAKQAAPQPERVAPAAKPATAKAPTMQPVPFLMGGAAAMVAVLGLLVLT
ncbi:MAG: serine/threonine protein kinase [Rhodobacter sp.]|nr:serine/threonine protein kinase [Rhodobacter sp.]